MIQANYTVKTKRESDKGPRRLRYVPIKPDECEAGLAGTDSGSMIVSESFEVCHNCRYYRSCYGIVLGACPIK